MGPRETERLLADVRTAVGDLIERNYFITSHMTRQLTTPQLKGVAAGNACRDGTRGRGSG